MTTQEEPAYAVEPGPIGGPVDPVRARRRRRLVAAVGVIVVAAVGLAVAVSVVGRLGQPPTPAGRVAFVDPAGALAIVDAQGGNRVVHAPPGTTFAFPAWSPDGSRVAAVSNGGDGAAIEVFDAAAGTAAPADRTVLFKSDTSAPFYLYWAPDGSAVGFLTQEDSSIALRSAPADGSANPTTLREGAPMYWAWEDPGRMLVHTGADTDAFLGAVGADGSIVSTVDALPGVFRSPSVSADGRYEAYAVAGRGGPAAVVVAASDGSTSFDVPVFGPAAVGFAPSGPQLAFIGAREEDREVPLPLGPLRVIDAGTGAVRQFPVDDVVTFFWSPDGRTIATIGVADPENSGPAAGTARLAAVRDDDRATRPTVDAPGVDVSLVFIDVASGTGTRPRIVPLSPLFVNQVMPYFDQYALSHRVWAPDGSAILLPLIGDDGEASLAMLPADGSAPRTLAPGSMGFWSP
ncbi:MAG TPA: hypothetical protein VIZ22_14920 [Candidatus Limnocylindrales bacterium]